MLYLIPVFFTKLLRLEWCIVTVAVFVVSLSSCQRDAVILYGQTFEQVRNSAQKAGAGFCVVLSSPDCPPCKAFIENVGVDSRNGLFRNTIFNIVDVSLPENRWYAQWICASGTPATCVFSPAGELTAVVAGASAPSLQCIQSALNDDAQCASYFYDRHYPVTGRSYLSLLNTLLNCKLDLDRGVDVGEALNACLEQTDYPWPVYLKCLNEEKQGRRDEAVYWAERLLEFDDVLYSYLYSDLYTAAKFIVDPNYAPEEDAALSVVEKVRLDGCKVGQPKPFAVEITNTGKVRLQVRDVRVSCTCVELLGAKQLMLEPGEARTMEFEFTAEKSGVVHREITFVSNGVEAVKQVKVEAYVQ